MSEEFACLRIEDPIRGAEYLVEIPIAHVHRATDDMEFVQELLEEARRLDEQGEQGPYRLGLDALRQEDTDIQVNSPTIEESASAFKWPHQAILLLVESYRMHEENMTRGKVSQKKTWESIAKELLNKGFEVTGPQCMSKFSGMKRTYKAIKDHNGKSGNNPRSWPYLDIMDTLLEKRPFMEPPALASSSGYASQSSSRSSSPAMGRSSVSECSIGDESTTSPSTSGVKRKRPSEVSVAQAILQSRRIAEENKEKRHKENLETKMAILEKLDKLLEKF